MKFGFPRLSKKDGSKRPRMRRGDSHGISVDQLFLLLVIIACGLVIAAGWHIYGKIASAIEQQVSRQTETQAANLVTAFRGHIEQYARNARALARDPLTVQLLEQGDDAALRRRESELRAMVPDALRVMLLKPDVIDSAAVGEFPQLNFSDIELIRQMAAGNTVPLETHLFGSPRQHFDVVVPVNGPAGQEPFGFLITSFELDALGAALRSLAVAPGYVEIFQRGRTGNLILAAHGDRTLQGRGAPLTVGVGGTRWQLAYWPPATGMADVLSVQEYWMPFVLVLVLLSVFLIAAGRFLSGALRNDLLTLIDIVGEKNMTRQTETSHRFRLKNFEGAAEILSSMTPAVPITPRRRQAAPKAGPVDTPVDLMFQEKEAMSVDTLEITEPSRALSGSIFKAYDIRGIVGVTLTPEIVHEIGRAIGSEAFDRGQQSVIVARDGRLSGPDLTDALIKGLCASGRDVINIGLVPTPVLYFATHYTNTASGVMLTGSHNPPDYNGMKIVLKSETLSGDAIQGLRQRIERQNFQSGAGSVRELNLVADYVQRIASDIRLARPLKVVIDCGNGAAGEVAPLLLQALGCDITELYCDIDGHFPNHHPDPSQPENLQDLIQRVVQQGADLGLAFDGDGDRLGVVDSSGKIIWPDRQMVLYARDVLARNPGAEIIFDVKCSRHLARAIRSYGGEPVMWKTGHSLIKARMKESGALLAGEMSGHIFFKERWFGFDDALYTAARLLEILSHEKQSTSEVFAAVPNAVSTPELRLEMDDRDHFQFMEQLAAAAQFPNANITTIDGIRVDFDDGWGLVRASNTTPCLVLRFEADSTAALYRIQEQFRELLLGIDPKLTLPF